MDGITAEGALVGPKRFQRLSGILALLLMSFQAQASGLYGIAPLAQVSLSSLPVTVDTLPDTIRVRIFPHLNNYPPQGLDTRIDQATFRSEKNCSLYEANPSGTGRKNDKPLRTGKALKLVASSLTKPVWIECPAPATLERETGKTSYSYPGPFLVQGSKKSASAWMLEVVNVIPLETYLRGVVPIEMPASWPEEALRAQAVAARTYAQFHIAFARGVLGRLGFDVDDTVYYQAYTGTVNRHPRTDQAVEATRSQIMLHQGRVIQAYFSADAGGHTEDADQVWSVNAPYCVGKPELFEQLPDGPWGPWQVQVSLAELNQKLLANGTIPNANPVIAVAVDPDRRNRTGRAVTVRLDLLDGASKQLDAQVFRRTLALRSTLFDIELSREAQGFLTVRGRGYGHGVGMSQVGAKILAESHGWKAEQILNFYFTGIELATAGKVER